MSHEPDRRATDQGPTHEIREVRNPVEARQGFLDRPVLAILIASIVLLVLGYVVIVGLM